MPPVTQALLITNVAVFLLQSATGGLLEAWFALWPPGHGFGIWQLLTYGFLHGGLAHIFFNMFALYMFGSDIERCSARAIFSLTTSPAWSPPRSASSRSPGSWARRLSRPSAPQAGSTGCCSPSGCISRGAWSC